MEKQQRVLLDISWEALLKVLALAAGIWAVINLKDILIMLFVVFIFVAAVNPTINRLQMRMSRLLAVLLFYVISLAVLILLSYLFIPKLVQQINDLVRLTPSAIIWLRGHVAALQGEQGNALVNRGLTQASDSLSNFSKGLLSLTFAAVGNLATALTGVVISFYLLLEEKNARDFFHQLLPPHRFEAVYDTVSKISESMGNWVRGQLLLILIIGASNLVAYLLIGLHSPLPLSIWAGLCEVIPYIGPTLGLIPALVVAITTGSILKAVLVVIISYGVIQQIEAHIVVPRIMSRALGLSPVLVIVALLVGTQLFGLVGALVAVPTAAIISVVVGEWPHLRKIWQEAE